MTVSEFAVAMYSCDIVKDRVIVIDGDKTLYDDRMEHLRYAHEEHPDTMAFAGRIIKSVGMFAGDARPGLEYVPDYITIINI